MALKNRVKLEFLSRPENVALARVAVATVASEVDFNLSDIEEIKVAVSEAVTNAVIHGYGERTNGTISLTIKLFSDRLEVIVEDYGKGIEDLEQALHPCSESEDPERLGLGFIFMKTFMDEVDVWSEVGKGTTVKLVKMLPGSCRAQDCAGS